MPVIGQIGGEFGFSYPYEKQTVTTAVTYNFPKAYAVGEMAMTECRVMDYIFDMYGIAYSDDAIQSGVSSMVVNNQTVQRAGESFVASPDVTSMTFYVTKSGRMSAWFRVLISFWA